MQTEDAPELTPEFLEDLRRYTEYGWGPGITAALLNRWHPVALTNLDVIRLRRRLGRAAAPAQDKTTPRLIQFHTLKNAANPPLLGGFSIFGTVAA